MKKKKIIIMASFLIGLVATIGGAFSAYILTNDVTANVIVESKDINVKENTQKFLSYLGISKKLSMYDGEIVEDVFSLNMQINQNEFNLNNSLAASSVLKLETYFESKNLFDYIKNDVKNEFVYLTYNDNYKLTMANNTTYMLNEEPCLEFSDSSQKCIFRIPFTSDMSNVNDFCIYKIASDNGLTSNKVIDPSTGLAIDNKWLFGINFNFKIVDDYYGYALNFNPNNFGTVSISMIFEDFK